MWNFFTKFSFHLKLSGKSSPTVDACYKRSRPIVMTNIAMGVGMMPLALGWGADPSFRSPMAVAVIGGLITSTLLRKSWRFDRVRLELG